MAELKFGDVLTPKDHNGMRAVYLGKWGGYHRAVVLTYDTRGLYTGPGAVDPVKFLIAFTPDFNAWEKDESWPT